MLETLWPLEFSGAFSGRTDLHIEFGLGPIPINAPLFRRKMLSVKKCFQKNYFSRKYFMLKSFFKKMFDAYENHKSFLYYHSITLTYKNHFFIHNIYIYIYIYIINLKI
jgi:hypothetical protein